MRVYSPAGPQIAARLHSKCTAERRCTINFDLTIHVESCHHQQSYPHPFNLEGQVQQHHLIIFGAGYGRAGVGIVELASVTLTVVSKNKCTNLAILRRELSPSTELPPPLQFRGAGSTTSFDQLRRRARPGHGYASSNWRQSPTQLCAKINAPISLFCN